MNLKKRLTSAFFISFLFAIGFGLIALFISDKKIVNFDNRISAYIQGLQSVGLTSVMKFFTFIGSGTVVAIIVIIVMILFYVVLKHRSELVLFIGVVIGSALLNVVLKVVFHRARPTIKRLIEESGYSFPSGHSMAAFTLYGILTFLLWKHISSSKGRSLFIIFSIMMTTLIGVSRIYLGVHYPSDVLGGFLASGTWLIFSIRSYQKYQDRNYRRKHS
ncbi:MAG: phosphatase PAP2 family protein [Paenibacillaceae bacterium]